MHLSLDVVMFCSVLALLLTAYIHHVSYTGFGSCLRAAMSVDLFVDCANEGTDITLERFLEGVADCGQRGHKDALKILWNCCSYIVEFEDVLEPARIIDMCYRLSIAAGGYSLHQF